MVMPISIHAPREGSDKYDPRWDSRNPISIHAPREGSDRRRHTHWPQQACHFYPRSPRGERPTAILAVCRSPQFLSTLPVRGATLTVTLAEQSDAISIHAPREGSDPILPVSTVVSEHFYPRSP